MTDPITPTRRVRMLVYDVQSGPENPIITSDEWFYGPDEIEIQAASLARNVRRHIETDS